ncbi:hypothetical protein [Roseibium sp. Sym1]|uniref:hypothetical protein n=1 Tax=Roseibium sp. Sym1 TaxID=3016006 RepID=UPI0022B313AC|nr:hypothetical protein [Roseibium sp. Sym1]
MTINANEIQRNAQENSVEAVQPLLNDFTPVQPIYPGNDYGNDHSTQPVDQINPEPKPYWPAEGSDLTPVQPIHSGDDYGNDHSTQPVDQINPEPKPYWPAEGSDLTPVQPIHSGDDYGNDHSTQPVDQINPEPKPYWPGEGSDLTPVQPIYSGDDYGNDHSTQPVENDLTPVQPIYPGNEGPIAVQPIYPGDGEPTPVQPVMPDWHCGTVENGSAFGNDTIAVHTMAAAGTDDQWWLEGGISQADGQAEANEGLDSTSGLDLGGHDGITGAGAAENASYESLTQDLIV